MNPNADRANRALLTLLALLLLVGAGFGLTLRFGVFGTARANQPLLLPVGTDRVRELDLERNTGAGATTVSTSAVTDTVTTEIAGYRGVERTSARLIGDQDSLDLVLTVTINDRGDLDAVRRRIEEHAVSHTRQALGRSQLPVQLHVQLAAGSTGALTGVQVKAPARTACHVPPVHHDHRRGRPGAEGGRAPCCRSWCAGRGDLLIQTRYSATSGHRNGSWPRTPSALR